jgi:crotonobetainyl-CoA:carnitine CoA-transferase CaiB-like acyl-CoA transferase
VAVPFEFHGTRTRHDAIEPQLGEHTREVLAKAGLSRKEVNSLIAARVARAAGK